MSAGRAGFKSVLLSAQARCHDDVCIADELAERHCLPGVVELPASGAEEPMADGVTRGDLDGRGAIVAGERDRRSPSGDGPGSGQDRPAKSGRCR